MSWITIAGKGLGKQQKVLFEDFSIPFPPELEEGGGLSLRELITRIVVSEVDAFQTRQEKRRLTRVLSPAQIEGGLLKGKVDSGGSDLEQIVDPEAAVVTALQAFEDGLYLVVVDEVE